LGFGGSDTLIGGNGADRFAFTAALGAANVDLIADFLSGILYDNATGNLFFDDDGNGAGPRCCSRHLEGHPALSAGDFMVT